MRSRRPFWCWLLLNFEMDSNLTWIGPPIWLACPCLPTKGEDILGNPLASLHMFGGVLTWVRVPREISTSTRCPSTWQKQRHNILMIWRPCRCDIEVGLDLFESLSNKLFHQVFIDLDHTQDEEVTAFPIKYYRDVDEPSVAL